MNGQTARCLRWRRSLRALAYLAVALPFGLISGGQVLAEPATQPSPRRLAEPPISADVPNATPSKRVRQPEAEQSRALPPPTWRDRASRGGALLGDRRWIATRLGWFAVIFVGLIVLQRCFASPSRERLAHNAIHVCGKVRLDARQSLHLVRVGQRVLVLHESPQGVQRLAEITEPDEVQSLLGGDVTGSLGRSSSRTDRDSRKLLSRAIEHGTAIG